MAFADAVEVPEAFVEVTVCSSDVQSTPVGRRQKISYRNNGAVASLATAGRLHIYTSELLSRLDRGEDAWVPDLQSSDDSADESPVKPTLKQLPKRRIWWNQNRNSLTYPGSDSANSDGEEEKPHCGGHQLTILRRSVSGSQSMRRGDACKNGTPLKKLPQSQLGKPKTDGGHASKSPVQERKAGEGHQVSCPDCGQSFKSKISLGNHNRVHSKIKPYKCPSCPESFTSKRRLGSHQQGHARTVVSGSLRGPPRPQRFECSACKKCFERKEHLLQHQKSHPTEQPPQCPECGEAFPENALLVRHQQTHLAPRAKGKGEEKAESLPEASEKKESTAPVSQEGESLGAGFAGPREDQINHHKCHFCGKCLRFRTLLVDHERMHREQKPYKCDQCNKSFLFKSVLLSHVKIHMKQMGDQHPKEVKSLAVEKACDDLGLFHSTENSRKGLVPRKIITRSFHHTQCQKNQRRRARYKCQYCGKSFITNSNLADHEKLHIMDKPYTCHKCTESFTRKHHLIRHLETHNGGKRIENFQSLRIKSPGRIPNEPKGCGDVSCGSAGTCDSFLVRHPKTSVQEYYVCQDCGKCMRTKSSFVNHRKIHQKKQQPYSHLEELEKNRPLGSGSKYEEFTKKPPFSLKQRIPQGRKLLYICQKCGKPFYDYYSFMRHEITHTGQKPFKCIACGKGFIQKWHLKRHEIIHLKNKYPKPHTVAEVNHENSPLDKKPFGCLVCGKGFCQPWFLKRHEKIHLSEERRKLSAVAEVNSGFSNSKNGTSSEEKMCQGDNLVQGEFQTPSKRTEIKGLWDEQELKMDPLAVLEKRSDKTFQQKDKDVKMPKQSSKKSKRRVLQDLQEIRPAVKLVQKLRRTDKCSVHQSKNLTEKVNIQCHKKGKNPAGWQLRSRRKSKRGKQLTRKGTKRCFCQQEEPEMGPRKKPSLVCP